MEIGAEGLDRLGRRRRLLGQSCAKSDYSVPGSGAMWSVYLRPLERMREWRLRILKPWLVSEPNKVLNLC